MLNHVIKLYNKGLYHDCIEDAKKALLGSTDDIGVLYCLIAYSYFFSNPQDINKAKYYLDKSYSLSSKNPYVILGLAYFYLCKDNNKKAIYYYTFISKDHFFFIKKTNKILNIIQKTKSSSILFQIKKISFFIPNNFDQNYWFNRSNIKPLVLFIKSKKLLKWTFFILFLLSVFFIIIYQQIIIINLQSKNRDFNNENYIWFNQDNLKTNQKYSLLTKKDYNFLNKIKKKEFLTKKQIDSLYREMKASINNGNYNKAIIIYNKVILSKASLYFKGAFDLLFQEIGIPPFLLFQNTHRLNEIINNELLKHIFFKTKGEVLNIEKNQMRWVIRFLVDDLIGNNTLDKNKKTKITSEERIIEIHFPQKDYLFLEKNKEYRVLLRYIDFDSNLKRAIFEGIVVQGI